VLSPNTDHDARVLLIFGASATESDVTEVTARVAALLREPRRRIVVTRKVDLDSGDAVKMDTLRRELESDT
jgi:hypothetical protein